MYQRSRSAATTSAPSSSPWMGGGSNFNSTSSGSNSLTYSVVGDDELKYNHPYKNSKNNRFYSLREVLYYRVLPCLILMVLPWIPAQITRSTALSKQKEIQSMIDEQKDLVVQLDEVTQNIRALEKDVVSVTKDNELNFQELERSGKLLKTQEIQNKEGYEEQEQEEEELIQRIDDLEKAVKLSATRRLEQRYV
jgi:septal ring factor EnvC (AmiA/AmiB activator)